MGYAILLFSRSCYRSLLKHLSWSPRQLEQVLLIYYHLRQTSYFSVMLLQSQLPHGGSVADLLPGAGCSDYSTLKLFFSILYIRSSLLWNFCFEIMSIHVGQGNLTQGVRISARDETSRVPCWNSKPRWWDLPILHGLAYDGLFFFHF